MLYRYTLPIGEHFGWTPEQVRALAWWEFEQAIEFVEQSRRPRNG